MLLEEETLLITKSFFRPNLTAILHFSIARVEF